MAKKKTPEEVFAPPAPARRRAPSKKQASPVSAAAPGNGGTEPTRAEIAEAAYYRHLNRGGRHGDEFNDWIEAERELKQRR